MTKDNEDNGFRPPMASNGIRMFPARSTASVRGFETLLLPGERHPRQIIYESILERKTLLLLASLKGIRNIFDQALRIPFEAPSGKPEHHIPDYIAEFENGTRTAIAVKPKRQVQRLNFRATLRAVERAMPLEVASKILLVTEEQLHPGEVLNAELISMFRRMPDPEADQALTRCLTYMPDNFPVRDLVSETGMNGRGFRAVFRAIYDDFLHADRHRPITPQTIITQLKER